MLSDVLYGVAIAALTIYALGIFVHITYADVLHKPLKKGPERLTLMERLFIDLVDTWLIITWPYAWGKVLYTVTRRGELGPALREIWQAIRHSNTKPPPP